MNMQAFGANIQQGAHIHILVAGQPVGYITQLTDNETPGTQAFYGIGTIMPLELQPLKWTGSMAINGARLYEGGWQSEFMYPGSSILTQGLVNIVVYNQITGAADAVYIGCAPTSYGTTYGANAYTLQNGAWLYLDKQVKGFGL